MRFVSVQKQRVPKGAKPAGDGYQTYHRIADRFAPILETKIKGAVDTFRKHVDINDIVRALVDDLGAEHVEGKIPWGELIDRLDLRDDLLSALQEAGVATDAQARKYLYDTTARPVGDLVFNHRAPEAEAWAVERSSTLIQGVTDESKRAVRGVIEETIRTGQDYGKGAQRIKDAVGLTRQGAGSVVRYRDMLETQNLGAAQVDRQTEAFRDRLLSARAETISRTETIASVNQGQMEYWDQLAESGVIDKTQARKTWVVTPDDRLCPSCEPLAGVSIGLDEMFQTDLGEVDGPPLHPNCRCALNLETE